MNSTGVFQGLTRKRSILTVASLTLQALTMLFSTASAARAALDPETKRPYHLQIALQVSASRVFTPLFQDQLERDVSNQLKLLFGDLAVIEMTGAHPLRADIDKRGLDAALEGYDVLSDRTTHFVLIDFVNGAYRIQTRFHDGFTGQPGPPTTPFEIHDRADLGRAIARLVEEGFCPVGTATRAGKDVTLRLKGGELGVPLDRWVKPGHVFAVSRIVSEAGRMRAQRLEWALLEVVDPPTAGVCRCRYWRRYQEDDLRESPGTLGYRALRLATVAAPVKVRLLDDATLQPLEGVRLRVQRPGDKKPAEVITNRDGLAMTRENFNHLALIQVFSGETVRAQFPVELLAGRTVIARVQIQEGGESHAPLVTRRDAWLRRIYDNVRLSTENAQDLRTQLHHSLDAALSAARKNLPALEGEIKYLDLERVQLNRLAKDKTWTLDAREGDQQLAELKQKAKELGEFVARIEGVLKETGNEKAVGLVQLLERARLHEAEAEFDQALRLYEQIVLASPGEKKVQAHLDELKKTWADQNDEHKKARVFILQTWPALDAAGLGENMEAAQKALIVCRSVGDKLTPRKLLRVNAGHTANLKKQLDTLNRRDTEDNRNQAKALARTGEALLRLHQDAVAWVGVAKE